MIKNHGNLLIFLIMFQKKANLIMSNNCLHRRFTDNILKNNVKSL